MYVYSSEWMETIAHEYYALVEEAIYHKDDLAEIRKPLAMQSPCWGGC